MVPWRWWRALFARGPKGKGWVGNVDLPEPCTVAEFDAQIDLAEQCMNVAIEAGHGVVAARWLGELRRLRAGRDRLGAVES